MQLWPVRTSKTWGGRLELSLWITLSIIYIVIYYLVLILKPLNHDVSILADDVFQIIPPVAVALICYRTGRTLKGNTAKGWNYIGSACLSWGLGQVAWTVYETAGNRMTPTPSLADVGYLLNTVLFIAGLICFLNSWVSRKQLVTILVDSLATASGLVLLGWHMIIARPTLEMPVNLTAAIITMLYPVRDICVVFFLANLHRGLVGRIPRSSFSTLLMGSVTMCCANILFFMLLILDRYETGSIIDPLWSLSFCLLGASAIFSKADYKEYPKESDRSSNPIGLPDRRPLYLIVILILGVGITLRSTTGGYYNFIAIGTQMLGVALLMRQYIVLQDNIGITQNLSITTKELKKSNEELHQQISSTQTLYRISNAVISAGIDYIDVLSAATHILTEQLGDACVIALASEDGNSLSPVAWHHSDLKLHAILEETLVEEQRSLEGGFIGIPIELGTPLRIEAVDDQLINSVKPRYRSYIERTHTHSAMFVPLRTNNRAIGTLVVCRDKTPNPYTESAHSFLQEIAYRLAPIIENAQLFDEVQNSKTRLQIMSKRLVETQENERRFIARELHDELGQSLTALKMGLEAVRVKDEINDLETKLQPLQNLANEMLDQIRALSLDLRPTMLDDLGLVPTLLWHIERFKSHTAINVIFKHSNIEDERYTTEIETAVYRIIQKGLSNVARHAKTNDVYITIWSDRSFIRIQIEDQGVGFDYTTPGKTTNGLSGMRERAMLLNGNFSLDTSPGAGTRLLIQLPLLESAS